MNQNKQLKPWLVAVHFRRGVKRLPPLPKPCGETLARIVLLKQAELQAEFNRNIGERKKWKL